MRPLLPGLPVNSGVMSYAVDGVNSHQSPNRIELATRVDGVSAAGNCEHAADFLATQDDGKLLVALRPVRDRGWSSVDPGSARRTAAGERLRTPLRQPRAQLQEVGPELVSVSPSGAAW
jgi:hypothetical protein